MKYLVGIDEAGRGPLAGPVAVGVVRINSKFDKKFFRGIRDSKKLTSKDRAMWFARTKGLKKEKKLDFAVSLISEKVIDKRGIVYAINLGMSKCLRKLRVKITSQIFLDGSLHAPKEFKKQKTIIRGDEKIPVISLASVCAKETRDRYMERLGKKYPQYSFEVHKGYGTLLHRQNIKKYGLSKSHRKSFTKNLTFI
ncbi:MAG: ribonuclease HII [Parcubacteria bacterium C7867-005]|nr:MAG: ribonuclease HII [Parcubacteria bacterium C7867-005]